MSLLILALPPGPPGAAANYVWARSEDGNRLLDHGQASAELLPASDRSTEMVAVVPATLLSWHRVELPRGIGPRSPRLRAVLTGLLEERLLGDPQELHFALDPDAGTGSPAWIAVCRRDWLAQHLEALDAARQTVARIVPELAPDAEAARFVVIGTPGRAQLLACGAAIPGNVQALPLAASSLALLRNSLGEALQQADLQAEPAVAALTENLFARPPRLVPVAERLLQASRTRWNLAQFELARSRNARAAQRVQAGWRDFWHASHWRPARWGLALLVLVQLAGLNLAAWQARGELAAQRAGIEATLRQTFPQVKLVVDAPVQMERGVALLRQQTGAVTARDLGPMLAAIAPIAHQSPPTAFEFAPGALRLKGVALSADDLTEARARLRPLGYRLDAEGTGNDASIMLRESALP